MRPLLAGAVTAALLLIFYFHAPLVPVVLGTGLVCGWRWWREHAKERTH